MFEAYKNKRVFITGHTGFKGSWLSIWLTKLGAQVCGYSLSANTTPSMFDSLSVAEKIYKSVIGNILDVDSLNGAMHEFQPDIVFHLAAQPLVRQSYFEPVLTYQTNVIGTLNVLEAARNCKSVKAFVNVTTDKCYENKETIVPYKEDEPMGGYDMYSSSKGCVEILSSSYRRSFLQNDEAMLLATARAGNVIGGGDWAIDRLVPDCIRSINQNLKIEIRNPQAVRPWQHVMEPLSGYILLGSKLLNGLRDFASGFNFGPLNENIVTVGDVVQKIIEQYGCGEFCVKQKDNLHEADLLTLDINKAREILGWFPSWSVTDSICNTVSWYKHFYEKDIDMYEYTINQIEKYEENIKWNKICVKK